MRYAKILSNDSNNGRIVSAFEIRDGIVGKDYDFIDVEEEFRVNFVKAAKNQGDPYFRLYWSHEEYLAFSQDKKSRYDILKDMRHYQDGPWHRGWEEKVRPFAEIERYIKNDGICKRADALIRNKPVVLEFQHSFIAGDFQSRNEFYSKLGYKTIWLFDVSQHDIVYENGGYIIVEDNARGIFKVIETESDLSRHYVYVQAKGGMIYRIKRLFRKSIDSTNKSTIRYFYTREVYTEDEFIRYLENQSEYGSLYDIWNPKYRFMIAFNIETKKLYKFYRGADGNITQQFDSGCIGYQYAERDPNTGYYHETISKFYSLGRNEPDKLVWKCVCSIS